MSINGVIINIGALPLSDFLTGAYGLESGSYEKNINGDGKLSLSWRSTEGGGLTAGTEATVSDESGTLTFYLQENYTPTPNGDGTYTWSPTFVSTDNKLKGILVYFQTSIYRQFGKTTSQLKTVKLYTYQYTGQAGTLVSYLNACDGVSGRIDLNSSFSDSLITVSLDQDNVISAAQKIANALGTNIAIENGQVRIGYHDALAISDYYDRFVVLGGTRNMGKHVINNDKYAAVTMRLTLDETNYPDSVMPANTPAEGHMTKILVFDEIFPEMKLKISSVRSRVCYLYDDEGKVIYVYDEGGQKVARTYTKFYIRLALENNQPYSFDVKSVIEGRTLGIVFHSGVLTGREFDLSYYDSYVDEYDSDEDVSQAEAHGLQGDFRICLVADGDTLLPNATLAPSVGDEVTLTGVALDGVYETLAKAKLLAAAQPYVDMYMSRQPTDVTLEEQEVITDFLTGESHGQGSGQGGDSGYITTSITTDLLTGRQRIHLGTFEPQGKVASIANKLETASVSSGGALVGGSDENVRRTAPIGLDQFKTLFDIYGHLGLKSVNSRIDSNTELIEGMQDILNDVQDQSDRSFDIWFNEGAPSPLLTNPTATANFPASEWDSDDKKELHVQDVYYDTSRPAGGTAGRAYRWVSGEDDNENTIYGWEEILDRDTIAALDQISDLSRDNVLTPSEKLVAMRDWSQILGEYPSLIQRASDAEVSSAEYCNAFYALWEYLNGIEDDMHSEAVAAYDILADYDGTQSERNEAAALLSPYTTEDSNIRDAYQYIGQSKIAEAIESLELYFASCYDSTDMASPSMLVASGNTTISGTTYKQLWSDYRNTKTALMTALSDKSIKELDDLASDNVLTDIEKITVIREYERIKQETAELLTRAAEAGLPDTNGSTLYAYRVTYSALYAYLNTLATSSYNILTVDLSQISNPEMLYNGETTTIVGTTFKDKFSDYYTAASNLRKAIQAAGPKVFSTTYQSTPPNPVPPYKAGDLWIHTDSDGNTTLRMCVNGRASGNYVDTDWVENEFYNDPRSILAALADAVYKAANPQSAGKLATVDLSQEYNIDIITPASGISLSGMVDVSDMLITLKAFIGEVTFGIYYISGGSEMYDLLCSPVMTTIPGSNDESLVGGITIKMYNGSEWEYIQQSTSSLLNNLGTAVNAIVFGSNDAAAEAAGLTIGQKFAKMFAQATVWDADAKNGQGDFVTLTQALFGLSIQQDGYGKYYSTALLRADKIDFSAGTFSIGADHITFTGKTIDLAANQIDFNVQGFSLSADKVDFAGKSIQLGASDTLSFAGGTINFAAGTVNGNDGTVNFSGIGTLNLNAQTVNLNANKLTWNNQTIISGDDGTGTQTNETKFGTDSDGNVTMNHAIMNNATVSGTITANAGKIGGTNGWTIEAQKLHSGTIGQANSMHLATTDLSATVAGQSLTTWRFTIGSKFGVTNDGVIYASDGTFTGTINASGGTVTGNLDVGEKSGRWFRINPDSNGARFEGYETTTDSNTGVVTNTLALTLGFGKDTNQFIDTYKKNGYLRMRDTLLTPGYLSLGGNAGAAVDFPNCSDRTYIVMRAFEGVFDNPYFLMSHTPENSNVERNFAFYISTFGGSQADLLFKMGAYSLDKTNSNNPVRTHNWPTSASQVNIGEVYLDGTTLRVRIS